MDDLPESPITEEDWGIAGFESLGRLYASLYGSLKENGVPDMVAGNIVCTHIIAHPCRPRNEED